MSARGVSPSFKKGSTMGKRIIAFLLVACALLAGCGSMQQGGGSDPRPIERKALNDYSWDELSRISLEIGQAPSDEEGRAIAAKYGLLESDGSLTRHTKQLVLNETRALDVRLAGIRHDDRSDGTGKAGLTFMSVGGLALRPMNEGPTIDGGWEASALRAWLAGEGKAMLEPELQAVLVPVNKLTNNVGITDDPASITPTSDALWLFAAHEVCGDIFWDADEFFYQRGNEDVDGLVNSEGPQYEAFALAGVTQTSDPSGMLSLANSTGKSPWWYRTPYPFDWLIDNTGSNGYFYQVRESGYPESLGSPEVPASVVFGFCV